MTKSKRFVRPIQKTIIVFAIWILNPLVVFADGFVFQWSTNGQQLALRRKVDDSPSSSEVLDITVFELVEDGTRLRRLHTTTLLPGSEPLAVNVSPCGRFIVTMDEWSGAGNTDRALVIYDAFRKESTSLRLEQFLDKSMIERLPPHGFVKGVKWRDWGRYFTTFDHFSIMEMKFYPSSIAKVESYLTEPKSDSSKQIPFVEVDLIERTAKVVPTKNSVPINLEREIAAHSKYHWTAVSDSSVPSSLSLPSRLEGSAEKGSTVRMVFSLERTGDYQLLRKE
ncbi:MAG: hypothetical protein ACK5ZC_16285 [Pirellulaceae bacterium]|jgi:hypothetical protein|nr:hypothetical protein [Pirellula sp.]